MAALLERIRSRKIFQWALAYLAGAWLVLQVVDVMADPWEFAPWTVRSVQALVALGLLITLVLAWYHGEKGRQRVSGPELVIIAALLGIGALLFRTLGPGSGVDEIATSDEGTVGNSEFAGTPSSDLRRRIAVLPLDNFTGDPDREHVVQGLHEAITFGLGTISSLDVISRTSVLGYADTEKSAPAIAEELGVGTVLSGSVMAQGDSVRITLQLIDALSDAHEWTDRFEGDLSDLMRLEDDIARAVARELRAHLTPREDSLLAASPRVDPRAGDAYLRARSAASRDERVLLLEEAIQLDPMFAGPYGELARIYGEMAFGGALDSLTASDLYDRVVRLADRGLQLDSTLASAYTALAEVAYHRDWDWEAGEAFFQRALEVNPSYSTTYLRISGHLTGLGRAEEAIQTARMAQAVDPRSPFAWRGLATNLILLRRPEEAAAEAEVAISMRPNNRGFLATRGRALTMAGRHEEGLADLESSGDSLSLALGLTDAGRMEEARRLTEVLLADGGEGRFPRYDLARLFAKIGDTEQAVALIEKLERERVGALIWVNVDPDLDAIRDDPRVQAILERMKFPGIR